MFGVYTIAQADAAGEVIVKFTPSKTTFTLSKNVQRCQHLNFT